MKFCSKCGGEIEENKSFCTKCGNPVARGVEVLNEQTSSKKQNNIRQRYKNLNKKQKILTITIGVIVILGIMGFSIGESLTSKKNVVSKFTKAITSKNTQQAAKYITSPDSKLKIETKKLENLLSYLDENPSYMDEVIKSIEDQSLETNSKLASKNNSNGSYLNELFTLKKQGKKWIFFDNYVLEIKPVYLNLSTNYKGTEIYLDDELICTTDRQDFAKEFGLYIPGKYNIKAVLKGEYVNLEKSLDVNLISSYGNSINVSLNLDGYTPSIECDYEDAKVFANGKDTGLQVKNAKKFGPIAKDGSVKLYAQKEFPWGAINGEETAVNGSSNIKLKLSGVNDQVQDSLMNTINEVDKSWCEAERLRDFSKFVNVTENMRQKFAEDIQKLINDKKYYIGELKKTVFDLDSIKVFAKNNKYYAEIKDQETYYGAFYNEGTTPTKTTDDVIWKYTLVYDETSKKWLQDEVTEEASFNASKKKEFNF